MTKYEKDIFTIINSSKEHLTAEQIFGKMRTIHSKVALATVYNNLDKLLETKLIQKVVVEGMPDRYDRAAKHDHIVCSCCGKIKDIRFSDLSDSLREQMEDEFLFYDLKVFSVCPDCQRKLKDSTDMES